MIWLSERPRRWGGAWGLGCTLCAQSLARSSESSVAGTCVGEPAPNVSRKRRTACASSLGRQTKRRLGCAWARYEVRPLTLQAEYVKQHMHYDVHKISERCFFFPDDPVKLALQANADDDRLLAGAVPQPEDWLRIWRLVRSHLSWQAAAQHMQTEHFISQMRERPVQRRALEDMTEIMREVIRIEKRQWIRDCVAICLTFDDRKGYKLVRFKCDMPLPHRGAVAQYARHGILGCVDTIYGATFDAMSEDYAVSVVDKVNNMIKSFASPLGETAMDSSLYDKFCASTRSIVVDGALVKTATVLKLKLMPNVVLICRDPAHMVRIACQEPLIRTGRFEEQHKLLFSDKHALLKDIQYSQCWQARLEACQKLVVSTSGAQGGDVCHILRHFSYAPHRFESFAGPRRQYACLLNAIFLCLCDIAGDWRQPTDVRGRAERCLDNMTPRDILQCGLAGDYG